MNFLTPTLAILLLCIAVDSNADDGSRLCKQSDKVLLQVLGSGGPIADDGRSSTGYLVWINQHSRFLIDTGGGTFLRFGEAGARFEDLSLIAISHFHTDHSSDLAAILKSGYFSNRTTSLKISGPGGAGDYPTLDQFLGRLLGSESGAYAYLSGYLDGGDGPVKLEPIVVDPMLQHSSRVYTDPENELEVSAIGVPHGPVPALAYRIRIGQKSLVFSGDQNGNSEKFLEFAQGADILVMHMPVPEGVSGVGRNLHAPPGVIGSIAAKTGAGKLILSHFMARSLADLSSNLDEIRFRYKGPIITAYDLECFAFG